ncbi:unnamed protein product [marine sediment metagenome]|uniref:Uncharacterized protein n=1 Tax=marine sediment metagenome TaxID=412755 RepID=X0YR79_9ZZZZ
MKINKQQLKLFCLTIIVLNIISLVLGLIYYAMVTTRLWWLWNVQGIIMFLSWLLNILLVYINDRILIKSHVIGKKLNRLCYYSLVFTIIAMFLLFFHTFIVSLVDSSLIIELVMSLGAFIGIAAFGIALAYLDIKNLEERGVWKIE